MTCRSTTTFLWKALAYAALASFSACTFDGSNEAADDGDGGSILPGDVDANDTPGGSDAEPGCAFSLATLCELAEPDGDLNFSNGEVIDTDNDVRCRDLEQEGGPQACLLWGSSVSVDSGVGITAVGNRPLVVASATTISISGTVDASSQRGGQLGAGANFNECALASGPQRDVGGAGGAAGGSFAARAGDGGVGDQDESLGFDSEGAPGTAGSSVGRPAFLRGGCPGGNGADESASRFSGSGGSRGSSGGALAFYAATSFSLEGSGRIRVTGGGGGGGEVQAGGGGGGSGGMLLIEGGTAVAISGVIGANGGAGGEGGVRPFFGPTDGQDGSDGALSPSGALGGTGLDNAGDGGVGSSLATLRGGGGEDADGGGGGGGGSAGFIILRGAVTINGSTSPAALVE
mgnify:FL=1